MTLEMTPDKVIRHINAYIAVNKELDNDEKKAFNIAFEALEKQIVKNPKIDDEGSLICPVCGENVDWSVYCESCGQKVSEVSELDD